MKGIEFYKLLSFYLSFPEHKLDEFLERDDLLRRDRQIIIRIKEFAKRPSLNKLRWIYSYLPE
jgi:hypothetical protein